MIKWTARKEDYSVKLVIKAATAHELYSKMLAADVLDSPIDESCEDYLLSSEDGDTLQKINETRANLKEDLVDLDNLVSNSLIIKLKETICELDKARRQEMTEMVTRLDDTAVLRMLADSVNVAFQDFDYAAD